MGIIQLLGVVNSAAGMDESYTESGLTFLYTYIPLKRDVEGADDF